MNFMTYRCKVLTDTACQYASLGTRTVQHVTTYPVCYRMRCFDAMAFNHWPKVHLLLKEIKYSGEEPIFSA